MSRRPPTPLTEKTVGELLEFVEALNGVPMLPTPLIEVEMRDGVLCEVGGNWRSCRDRLAALEGARPPLGEDVSRWIEFFTRNSGGE